MSKIVLILAGSTNEAYQYCHRAGIPSRNRRIAMRRGQLVGLRQCVVHALPSFLTAAHRHSVLAGLKWVSVEWHDVEMPEPLEKPAQDQGDGMGKQTSIDDFLEMLDALGVKAPAAESNIALSSDESEINCDPAVEDRVPEIVGIHRIAEPEPEPESKRRRRRSRCKACGELMDFEGHECPLETPAPDAAPEVASVEPTVPSGAGPSHQGVAF